MFTCIFTCVFSFALIAFSSPELMPFNYVQSERSRLTFDTKLNPNQVSERLKNGDKRISALEKVRTLSPN